MEEVIAAWTRDFKPAQQEVECLVLIARGKAIHAPMSPDMGGRGSSITGLNVRSQIASRRPSSQGVMSKNSNTSASHSRPIRFASTANAPAEAIYSPPPSEPSAPPSPKSSLSPYPDHSLPTPSSSYVAHSPAGPKTDYFSRDRQATSSSLSPSAIAAKKMPPPPPPAKRFPSTPAPVYVTAMYAFDGQNQGDLSFAEGERILVLKKTESTDDWWEGELKGVKGSFPANYCS